MVISNVAIGYNQSTLWIIYITERGGGGFHAVARTGQSSPHNLFGN